MPIFTKTLFSTAFAAYLQHGARQEIGHDPEGAPLTLGKLLQAACALGTALKPSLKTQPAAALLMPTASATIAAFFALQYINVTPAMLNVAAGAADLTAACRIAKVDTIITSRRFIERAELADKLAQLPPALRIVYLEDVKKTLSVPAKLAGLLAPVLALLKAMRRHNAKDTAVILFTSGSEGTPKAVLLSHNNLITNLQQLKHRVRFTKADIFFNCLPMFHSFGMMVGLILPVLCGVRSALYPSPLHYKAVPERIRATKATMMFSTDTFLNGYARNAKPDDFDSVRMIFSGAERLKERTRELYKTAFGTIVLQGYGVTETSPAIAVNTLDDHRPGTVGRLLEDIETRLEPVEGIVEGGRLFVRGPNVMRGYLLDSGSIQAPENGWHDTGDIARIDDDKFITILGRAKRFAKIGGEMVSLAIAENLAQAAFPEAVHAAVAIPDMSRGEQIVLYSVDCDVTRDDMIEQAHRFKAIELAVPKRFVNCASIPILGTGKIDYVTLQKLAATL